ncbi:ankyrin repeat domain-containing protein 39-like [Pocillopora verrucosa]|uniref:ankyrin repeat domain-containing protein 39-like n=1 Tax=Pocillopora verrucosa TaxID=203993 RepID=UPI00334161CD
MEDLCNHINRAGKCGCLSTSSTYAQSLSEMDFERGIWQAAPDEVSQLLPEQGADVNAQTKSGKVSSLHRAAYSGHMSVAAEKLQKEVVRLFVELDSSLVKVKDKNGRSPSDLASSKELAMLNILSYKKQTYTGTQLVLN